MFKIGICEDSENQVRCMSALIKYYMEHRPGVELCTECFLSAAELLAQINSGSCYDLLFLDILMPGMDGITLAKNLRAMNVEAPIVFLTSSPDYAMDAFSVRAAQYLLKPVEEQSVFETLDRILVQMIANRKKDSRILLHTQGRIVSLIFSTIVCVESIRRTLKVYLENGDTLHSLTLREPLEEAVAPLLADKRFLHAHKSFILNMQHVDQLTKNSFIMKNGPVVSVPRYKFGRAKEAYLRFLSEWARTL